MLTRFRVLAEEALARWGGRLLELNGEPDHVHLLISLPPTVAMADFVNNLKTPTARLLRKEFSGELDKHFWRHKGLWSRSYCVVSAGGAGLDVLKHYLEQQAAPTI